MTTNDCLKQLHRALVAKAKTECATTGNKQLAAEISGKIGAYGASWGEGFGDDGKLDDEEEANINAKFDAILDAHVPAFESTIVDKAWNGFSICFINVWKGIKFYLNQFFNLGLA